MFLVFYKGSKNTNLNLCFQRGIISAETQYRVITGDLLEYDSPVLHPPVRSRQYSPIVIHCKFFSLYVDNRLHSLSQTESQFTKYDFKKKLQSILWRRGKAISARGYS